MAEEIFYATPWVLLAAALALMALDAVLTLQTLYFYHSGGKEVILLQQVFTLDKPYDPRRGRVQFFSRRLALFLLGGLAAIPLAWYVFTRLNNLPWVFLFATGALLLFEAAECIEMGLLLTLFRYAGREDGIQGRVEVPRWLFANLRVVRLFGFAIFYLLLFLLTGSLFFLGGAAVCFLSGHSTRDVSIYFKLLKRKGR